MLLYYVRDLQIIITYNTQNQFAIREAGAIMNWAKQLSSNSIPILQLATVLYQLL